MGREMIDHELPQVLSVGGGHPDEVVGHAGQVKDHQDARQPTHGVGECVDLLARVDGELDRDQRLQRPAEGGEVDLGVEAADHASLAQRAQPYQGGRRRYPDPFSETLVGDAGIGGDELEDRAVGCVNERVWMIRHHVATSRY